MLAELIMLNPKNLAPRRKHTNTHSSPGRVRIRRGAELLGGGEDIGTKLNGSLIL